MDRRRPVPQVNSLVGSPLCFVALVLTVDAGQGSHFSGAKDPAGDSFGGPESATAMDSSRQGELGSTISGQQINTTGANVPQTVGGLEGAGTSHVGTADSSQIGTGDDGSAAIGSTSTYSSHHLTKGDPTSGIIDHQSRDPTTFQTPEKSAVLGVPSGAATTAASTAFNNGKEREGTSKTHCEM